LLSSAPEANRPIYARLWLKCLGSFDDEVVMRKPVPPGELDKSVYTHELQLSALMKDIMREESISKIVEVLHQLLT
jgi:hypothetical protein